MTASQWILAAGLVINLAQLGNLAYKVLRRHFREHERWRPEYVPDCICPFCENYRARWGLPAAPAPAAPAVGRITDDNPSIFRCGL